jgi:hypothetical protein
LQLDPKNQSGKCDLFYFQPYFQPYFQLRPTVYQSRSSEGKSVLFFPIQQKAIGQNEMADSLVLLG